MRKAIAGIVMSFWAFPAFAEGVVIAALGDSLTQGYGLQQADGFVPQLETWLQDQGAEVTLINAGVSGDTTAGGASRVAWTLTPEVDAMIVALGGNDLLRGIDPSVGRANLESILQAAKAADVAVLLVGMQAPGNYGPAYKEAFDAMYPELAAQYGALFQDSFFDGLGGAGLDPAQARPFLQADGIHPNADGVKKIVEGFGPNVLALIKAAQVADGS
ncbi:arylesterase [Ascidiaceihabitans sp.]|uniref:arylesterase n=1 Tax=Ascidiaceihabitans sp. TaxID=1872644 RepID=UPI003297CFE4